MKDIEYKISLFIDNELPENEQADFFKYLSEDKDSREMLSDLNKMKTGLKEHYNDIKGDMDFPLTLVKGNDNEKKYKTYFYYAAAASLLFLILSISLLVNAQFYKEDINKSKTVYESVKNDNEKLKNEITQLITEKSYLQTESHDKKTVILKTAAGIKITPNKNTIKNNESYYTFLDNKIKNAPVVKISKSDFITQQMIGN